MTHPPASRTSAARPEDDPILGEDGYPHEQELNRIREWPWEGGFRPLMDYVHRRWMYADAGYWSQRGDRFRIATGGWSGNEDIIGALEANQMFAMLCPVSWQHGGLYIYDVQRWDDNPEPDNRKMLRDPATPLDEHGFVVPCDHVLGLSADKESERWVLAPFQPNGRSSAHDPC